VSIISLDAKYSVFYWDNSNSNCWNKVTTAVTSFAGFTRWAALSGTPSSLAGGDFQTAECVEQVFYARSIVLSTKITSGISKNPVCCPVRNGIWETPAITVTVNSSYFEKSPSHSLIHTGRISKAGKAKQTAQDCANA
jgi:hypothetical protein